MNKDEKMNRDELIQHQIKTSESKIKLQIRAKMNKDEKMNRDELIQHLIKASESKIKLQILMGRLKNFSLMLVPIELSMIEIENNSDHVITRFKEDCLSLEECCEIYKQMKIRGSFMEFENKIINPLRKIDGIKVRHDLIDEIVVGRSKSIRDESFRGIGKKSTIKERAMIRWKNEVSILESACKSSPNISQIAQWREAAVDSLHLAEKNLKEIRELEEEEEEMKKLQYALEVERDRPYRKMFNYFDSKGFKIITERSQFLESTPVFGVYLREYKPRNRYGPTAEGSEILSFKDGNVNGLNIFEPYVRSFINAILTHSIERKILMSDVCLIALPGHVEGPARETNPFRRIFIKYPDLMERDLSSKLTRNKTMQDHSSRTKNYVVSDHEDSFDFNDGKMLHDKFVIVFDDIYTSGATMWGAINKLKLSEPKFIFFITIGKTVQ